jgi:hypothetical protein
MAADCAEFAFNTLKATGAITDLITGGADSIFGSGELKPERLAEMEEKRREDQTPDLVLAVVVQDIGEKEENETLYLQRVRIWIFDRERGYGGIRTLRKQVYLALHNKTAPLDDPLTGRTAMLKLQFQARTGHRWDQWYAAQCEFIEFASPIQLTVG